MSEQSFRFPNYFEKHQQDSLLEPAQYMEYLRKRNKYPTTPTPEGVILCYQTGLLEHIKKNHKDYSSNGLFSGLHYIKGTNSRVAAIGNFGIGSPAASVILEELIAYGVKKFISIGTAGTLQKEIKIGDLVLCERAIRDEGTSYHYFPAIGERFDPLTAPIDKIQFAYPDKELTSDLQKTLQSSHVQFALGSSWTIDAPYRETVVEARHYQELGVSTVEMEASALFSVAKYRKVKLAAMFAISDSLADLKWHPEFHSSVTQAGLEAIFSVARDTLLL